MAPDDSISPSAAVDGVSLVIPGRNCAVTIGACLEAVKPMTAAHGGPLCEVIFVDDGSTDETASIVAAYPVRVVTTGGCGPAAARNAGWRAATGAWIWFIDSDCIAEPDALDLLLAQVGEPAVAAVGGSYGNMREDSRLARLIHEEIVARHARMPRDVDYLATFNLLCRRDVLEQLDGFDDRFITAEDVDFSWRLAEAGYRMRFEFRSRVGHHHEVSLRRYLRMQARHGRWRVLLHGRHRGRAVRNSYSGLLDHAQPPIAVLAVASVGLVPTAGWWVVLPMAALLAAMQGPMTVRLVGRTGRLEYAAFAALGFVRAFWRGAGMIVGVVHLLTGSPAAGPSARQFSEGERPAEADEREAS